MGLNPITGPFAIVDRINLFEDEEGLHAAIVNPECINRTVLLDDRENPLFSSHRSSLRDLVRSAIPGEISEKQFGPIRAKGYIDRTMGIMAGGPFNQKIKTLFVGAGESLAERADHFPSSREGFQCPGLAHAGAYPIEIVITSRSSVYYVRVLDVMYRMKMYFEDAGKMAFAKNMGMPGSIEKSIRSVVEHAYQQ